MYRAAWKSLLSRKARLFMSALAIVLGVAFVSGSLIFTHMLGSTFDGIMKGTVADVNVDPVGTYTSSNSSFDSTTSTAGTVLLSAPEIAKFRTVEGVKSATGTVFVTGTYPVGRNGKVIASTGAPGISINWFTDPAAGGQVGVVLKSGHAPEADDQVVIDPTSLQKSGYQLGDTMKLVLPDGHTTSKQVVGTAVWGGGGTVGATYVFFTTSAAQQNLLQGKKGFTGAWITADKGADINSLVTRVQAVTPKNFEAVSGQTASDATASAVNKAMSFITTFLLVFAGIALLVASFLIVNTFSIIVAQRGRELALFRAIGASRQQVTRTVLFEAAVTGLIGSTLGLALGWLLAIAIRGAFRAMDIDLGSALPTLTTQAIIASYAVGMVVTMFAAWLPARRAGHVPPIAAMGGEVMTGQQGLGRRALVGTLMVVIGAVGMVLGLWTHIGHRIAVLGAGAALVLVGMSLTSPLLGRPVIAVLGWVYRRLFGQVGRLAEVNSLRQPRRTAATASALMLSLALVTTLSVLGASTSKSIRSAVVTTSKVDFSLSSVTSGPMPADLPDLVRKVSGVQDVYPAWSATVLRDGKPLYLGVDDPSSFNQVIDERLVSGSLPTKTNTVLLKDSVAQGVKVGDTITVTTPVTRKQVALTVSGIYTAPSGVGGSRYIVNRTTGAALGAPKTPVEVDVRTAPGADAATVRSGLEKATADLPTVVVMDNNDIASNATSQVDQLLQMIYALLGLAVVIAVLGIVNTLALSVIERTRELGLLRAIGMVRPQLRRMITLESVIIALLGSVLGVLLGMAFGAAIQHALVSKGLKVLVFPWRQLVLFLVAAGVVGVVAAVWPARRAARLDVLQAIATE